MDESMDESSSGLPAMGTTPSAADGAASGASAPQQTSQGSGRQLRLTQKWPTLPKSVFRFKYPEAGNEVADGNLHDTGPPEGILHSMWNKTYNAADSRRYNFGNRKATASEKDRASDLTRKLAYEMLTDKILHIGRLRTKKEPILYAKDIFEPGYSADDYTLDTKYSLLVPKHELMGRRASTAGESSSSSKQARTADAGESVPSRPQARPQQPPSPPSAASPDLAEDSQFVSSTIAERAKTSRATKAPSAAASLSQDATITVAGPSTSAELPFYQDNDSDTNSTAASMGNKRNKKGKKAAAAKSAPGTLAAQLQASFESRSQEELNGSFSALTTTQRRSSTPRIVFTKKGKGSVAEAASPTPAPGSDVASDDDATYCICNGRDDHTWMVECERCKNWFHGRCIGIAVEEQAVVDHFACSSCRSDSFFTTFKPYCRRHPACNEPARVTPSPGEKPSKYCSQRCCDLFFEEFVAKLPDADEPSRGGALSRQEVALLVLGCKNIEQFKALGQIPTIEKGDDFRWDDILNEEERTLVAEITAKKERMATKVQGYKEQDKFVYMAKARADEVNKGRPKNERICGMDERLAKNQPEFLKWKNTAEGIEAFATGKMPVPEKRPIDQSQWGVTTWYAYDEEDPKIRGMCIRNQKACAKHNGWFDINHEDNCLEIRELHNDMKKATERETAIKERAEARAAEGKFREMQGWVRLIDGAEPDCLEKFAAKVKARGGKSFKLGIPKGKEAEYYGLNGYL